jgi:hypothetical protein
MAGYGLQAKSRFHLFINRVDRRLVGSIPTLELKAAGLK